MADNFTSLWRRLGLRAPALDSTLHQDIIRDCFNQLVERREWSWAISHTSIFPPVYPDSNNITASIAANSAIVTLSAAYFTPDMQGKQIRLGGPVAQTAYPTYTLLKYLGPTQAQLDTPWIGPDMIDTEFTVFQCYFPVPDDFQYFISMVNSTSNYRVWTDITQATLDTYDPQRSNYGNSYAMSLYDANPSYQGIVGSAIHIVGNGTSPVSTTDIGYTYPENSIYTIKIVVGGVIGTATFQWQQDSQGWSPVITTPDDESAYFFSNGVAAYFPAGNYAAGDMFAIQCLASEIIGVPRYEMWPRPIQTPYVYPYLYRKVLPPLSDDNPTLPPPIARRGDVLLEMAMMYCAQWPGTETTRNPYYDLNLARRHEQRFEYLVNELELKDDDTAIKNISYQEIDYYPAPWMDGRWLQRHAIYGG